MITIHRAHGMRFVIYPNDHEPAHVHVYVGRANGKINLAGRAEVVNVKGMTRAELSKALDVVATNRLLFLSEWRRIHGQRH